ncbi:MAG TPA: spore germination protein [Firmicutes bacterium]|nr:spore germination protein [Bacillota bacterium]
MRIDRHLNENLRLLRETLGVGVSFDVIVRPFRTGGRDAALIFIDGFIKDKVTQDIIAALQWIQRADLISNVITKLLERHIAAFEVDTVDTLAGVVDQILAGPAALLIDGEEQAIILDVREYPVRSIAEPDLEKVTRGSHDGFVETVVFNTALIRRRVRDPNLRFEMLQVGARSKTDVAIGYIADIVNLDIVDQIKRRIAAIQVDALVMGAKSLEEYLFKRYFNPLPRVRYTERPDVATVHLLEGHVVILVDTTPMAMILPVTLFHFTQHAEEYFHSPLVGTYLRWVRMIGIAVALWITPLWLALYLSKPDLPQWLQFIGTREASAVPVFLQFLLLEVGLDLIRMALIHTPGSLSTSLGIVGAILLGDLAIQVGLFVPETILYSAVAAVGYFAIPSAEFGLAVRLFRYMLLAAVIIGKLTGLVIGSVLILLLMVSTGNFGVPYLWPLCPLSWQPLLRLILRFPIPAITKRPQKIAKQDPDAAP